jgi:hypothetical protein
MQARSPRAAHVAELSSCLLYLTQTVSLRLQCATDTTGQHINTISSM